MDIRVGLLISGDLGFIALQHLKSKCNVIFVFTNQNSKDVVEECRILSIPIFIGNPRKKVDEVENILRGRDVDYIISINYLYIVENIILKHPKYFSVNFHGSLLPKYRGRTPHVWAIINGETETGVSVHKMDEECDNGDIIFQEKLSILPNDTGADILNKFKVIYPKLLDRLLQQFIVSKFDFTEQNKNEATYFGKRSPDNGEINWNWQKERINNWVRAQAFPYPGAFTYYKSHKIVIDKIKYSEVGYSCETPNGTIVKKGKSIFVKTPNGVIEIISARNIQELDIELFSILGSFYEN